MRLPSEHEWLLAAYGPAGDDRLYPWGDVWQAGIANCNEQARDKRSLGEADPKGLNLAQTTVVGLYPRGAAGERSIQPEDSALALAVTDPASEQAADLRDHGADMAVLPVVEPAPMVGQTQVQPQPRQRRVAIAQHRAPGGAFAGLSQKQPVLQIQRRVHEPLSHRMSIDARKPLGLWQQPLQQVL